MFNKELTKETSTMSKVRNTSPLSFYQALVKLETSIGLKFAMSRDTLGMGKVRNSDAHVICCMKPLQAVLIISSNLAIECWHGPCYV